jgi:CrcB protein
MTDDIVDPDVDLHDPAQRAETVPRRWDLVLATSVGGVAGAEARYGLGLALPHGAGSFPWSTVVVNATGSLLLGVLMAVLLALPAPHRLLRPLLGVGVLGGYTTYSTFAVDAERLVREQRPAVALGYVGVTLAACLAGVLLGSSATAATGRRLRRAAAIRRSAGR